MKAVVCTKYGSSEVLQLKEVEKPVPGDNEILVKIHATTVSKADSRVRSFTVPLSFWLIAWMTLGFMRPKNAILGGELAGEIEATGKAVKRFGKGDRIFAATGFQAGGYAEYACLPEDGVVAIKPSNLDYGEAAAIPIAGRTALHHREPGTGQIPGSRQSNRLHERGFQFRRRDLRRHFRGGRQDLIFLKELVEAGKLRPVIDRR